MYSLTDVCYVCLEMKDKSLINITSSLLANEDIIHILGYLPCNLAWMKTKQIILICEECCRRLRETYQFVTMCLKNSEVLQGYMNDMPNAELRVDLNNKQDDIDKIKCEIQSEDEEIYTFESAPVTEETADVFVNVDDYFVKEEIAWKSEKVDDEEEPLMDNKPIESSDNEPDSAISVNSNTHATDTDIDSSTSAQGHTTIKKQQNTSVEKSHKCVTCGKYFRTRNNLLTHARIHSGEKRYKCNTCEKCFRDSTGLTRHTRIHTGEKPYECAVCKKCFIQKFNLVVHMRTHNDEKPYKCSNCNRSFKYKCSVRHIRKCFEKLNSTDQKISF